MPNRVNGKTGDFGKEDLEGDLGQGWRIKEMGVVQESAGTDGMGRARSKSIGSVQRNTQTEIGKQGKEKKVTDK